MENFTQQLIELGYDGKEAKVYLALLKLGNSGTAAIIKETGLHGQFVYNSLKKLQEEGLVEVSQKNGRNRYSALSPYKLINKIKDKERKANELVESLNQSMTIKNYQEVSTFHGEEEFRSINFDALNNEPSDGEIMIIGGEGDRYLESMGQLMNKYEELRLKKKVTIRYIGNESQRQALTDLAFKRKWFEARILPGLSTGLVNTNIFNNEVLLNIFGTPLYVIRIQSRPVTESNKNFFNNLWQLSKKI